MIFRPYDPTARKRGRSRFRRQTVKYGTQADTNITWSAEEALNNPEQVAFSLNSTYDRYKNMTFGGTPIDQEFLDDVTQEQITNSMGSFLNVIKDKLLQY